MRFTVEMYVRQADGRVGTRTVTLDAVSAEHAVSGALSTVLDSGAQVFDFHVAAPTDAARATHAEIVDREAARVREAYASHAPVIDCSGRGTR